MNEQMMLISILQAHEQQLEKSGRTTLEMYDRVD